MLIVVFGPSVWRAVSRRVLRVTCNLVCQFLGGVWVPGTMGAQPDAPVSQEPARLARARRLR